MTIGIVGLGYVGLPLAVAFAEAGQRVVGVDTNAGRVNQLRTGESYIEDIPSERLAGRRLAHRGHDPRTAARPLRRDHHRRPDAADGQPRARARAADRRRAVRRRRAAGRPAGRPRVHHLPGHDARARPPDPRGDRPAGRPRLPPRLLARARRSGQRDLRPRQHAEDHRRPHPGLPRPRRGHLRPRLRAGRPGLDPRGRRDGQAAGEHLPLGQHRARQRAGAPGRPDGASTSARSSTPRRPSRSASCASSRAPAWAATACRWTPST